MTASHSCSSCCGGMLLVPRTKSHHLWEQVSTFSTPPRIVVGGTRTMNAMADWGRLRTLSPGALNTLSDHLDPPACKAATTLLRNHRDSSQRYELVVGYRRPGTKTLSSGATGLSAGPSGSIYSGRGIPLARRSSDAAINQQRSMRGSRRSSRRNLWVTAKITRSGLQVQQSHLYLSSSSAPVGPLQGWTAPMKG